MKPFLRVFPNLFTSSSLARYPSLLLGPSLLSGIAFTLMVSSPSYAQDTPPTPQFETEAEFALIMDFDTGQVLFEKNARVPMKPASMTKMMTAELVFDMIKRGELSLTQEFEVSEDAWNRGGWKSGSSTMGLKIGEKVSVEDLLKGVIIVSGNDACIVLAEGIAGSESAFADMMTARARDLGLQSATFRNATGWPHPEHEISAHDLAQIAQLTIKNHPELYALYSQRSFTWNEIRQPNRNPIFRGVPGADGLKTGHTQESGYGFVGSALRGGQRKITVVNGLTSSADRTKTSKEIMSAAFDAFKIYTLYEAGAVVSNTPVYMGKSASVELMIDEPVKLGLYRPLRKDLSVKVVVNSPIPAPIAKGDVIGELIVSAPNKPDTRFALKAASDVERKGAFARAKAVLIAKIRG